MKTIKSIILPVTLLGLLASSCSKVKDLVPSEGQEINEQAKSFKKYDFEPTVFNLSNFDKDGLQGLLNKTKQNSMTFLRDSAWADGKGKTSFYESTEIPAVLEDTRRKLYLGAIIKGEDAINVDNVNSVFIAPQHRNPITMYVNFPTDSIARTTLPSKRVENEYLRNALKAGSGIQIQSFTYEQSQFQKTEELKKSFGANLDLGKILTVDYLDTLSKSTFKTKVRAEFTQENFSVNIEPPIYEPFLKESFDIKTIGPYEPLIVSSVTYGRKGIFFMESDSSYSMVKQTLNVAFNLSAEMLGVSATGKLGDKFYAELSLRLTKQQIALIQNARIKVYIIGVDGKSTVEAVTGGLAGFAKVIAQNGNFTPDNPGVILYYSLNYLRDFGTFRNKFKLNIAY